MSKKEREKLIRICVLGASFTGKSTLCNRFVNNRFEWIYEPTVEVGIFRKLINITDDEEHKQYCMMQIEDLFPINHAYLQMGRGVNQEIDTMMDNYDLVLSNKRSEKKKSNEKVLYKETFIHGYMYVYDLNSVSSLDELEKVIEYIHIREEKEAGKKKSGLAAKIIVGTKKDACGSTPVIPVNRIEQLKKKYNLMSKRVSALTNYEVKQVFLDLARSAMDRNSADVGGPESENEEESGGFLQFFGCTNRDKTEKSENESKCIIF